MSRTRYLVVLSLVGLTVGTTACTDEGSVFEQPAQFQNPPTEALGFLGYTDRVEKVTACGACHAGRQAAWTRTSHARAWETLRTSGEAESFCEGCHAVSSRGNALGDVDVGWDATGDPRYHDVQCESCHGGGLDHLNAFEVVKPQASIAVLDEADKAGGFTGCGECHQGAHQPFVDEWSESAHARVNPSVLGAVLADPDRFGSCLSCHSGQGALEAWGVSANYVESEAAFEDHVGITCAVCHDPHEAVHSAQLRFPVDALDQERNLCMQCHNRAGTPDPSSSRGPHAPEGPLLRGEAGWFPPNFPYEPGALVPSHGRAGNPRLCAGCHVNRSTITGDLEFNSTGHLFLSIPCLDENGVPVPGDCDIAERDFSVCAVCHTTADEGRDVWTQSNQQLAERMAQLQALLDQVPGSEIDATDGVISVAEGATFNVRLAATGGSAAHNGILLKFLLAASIEAVKDEYGVE